MDDNTRSKDELETDLALQQEMNNQKMQNSQVATSQLSTEPPRHGGKTERDGEDGTAKVSLLPIEEPSFSHNEASSKASANKSSAAKTQAQLPIIGEEADAE